MEAGSAVMVAEWFSETITEDFPTDSELLVAEYTYEDYSGNAFVLYHKHDKLYEVHGSHCSCFGLENQWVPEEAFVKALEMRVGGTLWERIKDIPLVAMLYGEA